MCEESASIELRSLDIALCVDEVTQVIYFMFPKDVFKLNLLLFSLVLSELFLGHEKIQREQR